VHWATFDCESIVLGGRLPRTLARRIVDGVQWPELTLPERRGVREPPTTLAVAAVEPNLGAPLGAAALILHHRLFI